MTIGIHSMGCPKNSVTLIVEDKEPGIPRASIPHIFKPFYRVEGDRERKTGGAGVGLAIAYRAVKLHKGNIRAENLKDGGLKMTITIPETATAYTRLDNDERFTPRSPNSRKQHPEEPIRHSNFRPLVCPSQYGQLLAKCKVFGSEIRNDFEL